MKKNKTKKLGFKSRLSLVFAGIGLLIVGTILIAIYISDFDIRSYAANFCTLDELTGNDFRNCIRKYPKDINACNTLNSSSNVWVWDNSKNLCINLVSLPKDEIECKKYSDFIWEGDSCADKRIQTSSLANKSIIAAKTINSVQIINVDYSSGTPLLKYFSPSVFSTSKVESALKEAKKAGFNTVRLVYHTYTDGEPGKAIGFCKKGTNYVITDCLQKEGLDNLAYTIKQAQTNKLQVILSFVGGNPTRYYSSPPTPYTSSNATFLKEDVIQDYGRFLVDILRYLNSQGVKNATYLAVQPFAEPSINSDTYPFNQQGLKISYPQFYVPSEKSYIVNNSLIQKVKGVSSPQMKEIVNFSIINSFNYWNSQIKNYDSRILTLHDQFPEYAVRYDNNRHVVDAILYSQYLNADIVGAQLYRDYLDNYSGNLSTLFQPETITAISNLKKPFLVMEYGFDKTHVPNLSNSNGKKLVSTWLSETCALKPDGWNLFNWDSTNFTYLTAKENNYELGKYVSDIITPQMCLKAFILGNAITTH